VKLNTTAKGNKVTIASAEMSELEARWEWLEGQRAQCLSNMAPGFDSVSRPQWANCDAYKYDDYSFGESRFMRDNRLGPYPLASTPWAVNPILPEGIFKSWKEPPLDDTNMTCVEKQRLGSQFLSMLSDKMIWVITFATAIGTMCSFSCAHGLISMTGEPMSCQECLSYCNAICDGGSFIACFLYPFYWVFKKLCKFLFFPLASAIACCCGFFWKFCCFVSLALPMLLLLPVVLAILAPWFDKEGWYGMNRAIIMCVPFPLHGMVSFTWPALICWKGPELIYKFYGMISKMFGIPKDQLLNAENDHQFVFKMLHLSLTHQILFEQISDSYGDFSTWLNMVEAYPLWYQSAWALCSLLGMGVCVLYCREQISYPNMLWSSLLLEDIWKVAFLAMEPWIVPEYAPCTQWFLYSTVGSVFDTVSQVILLRQPSEGDEYAHVPIFECHLPTLLRQPTVGDEYADVPVFERHLPNGVKQESDSLSHEEHRLLAIEKGAREVYSRDADYNPRQS
jgi:hypothetical protein